MKASKKRGFTIVELIIVIAVIAILAAVLIPTFSNLISRANESVDIQAARNMNTFLATAKYTSGVSSILDVYDVFEESGFKVENYSPLYKGRHYYYDIGYNQILYVDDGGTVLYPEEHKGEQKRDRSWCSLSMETMTEKEPTVYNTSGTTVTATVTKPEELAYVVNKYNSGSNTKLEITVKGEIDMMGASCTLREIKDGSVTIKGEGSNAAIKNVTSNKTFLEGANNTEGVVSKYNSAALFSKISGGAVTIENVTFENLNVKTIEGGGVGLLIGAVNGSGTSVTLNNVTIKNSTVIGHRDVGALVGQMNNGTLTIAGPVELDNVAVKTIGGRSAMLCRADKGAKIIGATKIKINGNCTHEIYKCKDSEQKFANTPEETASWSKAIEYQLAGQEKLIYSFKGYKDGTKQYSVYGFNSKALVIRKGDNNGSDAWPVYTTLQEVEVNYPNPN